MNAPSSSWLNKVPEVTLSFWIIKIFQTGCKAMRALSLMH